MYLHRIINKQDTSWLKKTFFILDQLKIGWTKSIKETLINLDLPTEFSIIQNMTRLQWKRIVDAKIEVKNQSRLLDDCHKTVDNQQTRKTKTAHIVDHIKETTYVRRPIPELSSFNKQETKTLMISRFGMLECGKNFKGTMRETCDMCKVFDDENHRLNHCATYRDVNLYDVHDKVDFSDIFSSDVTIVKTMIKHIGRVWNVSNAHGSMNKQTANST